MTREAVGSLEVKREVFYRWSAGRPRPAEPVWTPAPECDYLFLPSSSLSV